MARPRATRFSRGNVVRGTIYDFMVGDVLDVHTHDIQTNHTTIVTNGVLEVIGKNANAGRKIVAGDIVDWTAGEPHGFRSITPARIVNLLINSTRMEDGYDA